MRKMLACHNYDNLPEFLMLVGLPGSGKSTYIKKYFNQNIRVHSSDAIREELCGDETNQDINSEVFKVLHNRVKEDLKNGISCVYDATNISWKRRKAFLQELNSIPCIKICHIIATPFEVCLEQNKNRDRVVPYYVMERMYRNFDIPWYNEGWDDIDVWYEDKKYKEAYDTWERFLDDTKKFDQESQWHTLTLGEHCKQCSEYIRTKAEELNCLTERECLIAGALHDCGKPFCQTFKDAKGNESENAHYYNHENVGSYNSLFYKKTDGVDNLLVAALIRWHMILHHYKNWKQKTIDKYNAEFTSHNWLKEMEFYKALKILHEGDKNAH